MHLVSDAAAGSFLPVWDFHKFKRGSGRSWRTRDQLFMELGFSNLYAPVTRYCKTISVTEEPLGANGKRGKDGQS
ncbi:hypothetical protein OS493_035735 [Desmophyllum pertusum]|uniref:Uncharacterized protein n=1 Tax=Desmophyllum pertusum TaxID=174260 RepID=A0A9X0D6M7_9CNID|nr:hypothetical protein OS493_035735 [Desmophyllum pertusum]